jgi:hypothetical protein
MERLNTKELNEVDGKGQYRVEVPSSQMWETQTLRWMLLQLGKLLERISTFQPKRHWVIMK